jgi:DNA-binding transcriptional regulator WhiA
MSSSNGTDEKKYSIKIDDTLTAIYRIVGTAKKEIKKADLKTGDYVIVTGLMLNDTLEAMEIYIDEQFIVRTASVTELSKTDFYLKVITHDKDEYILDIQSATRQFMLNTKTREIEKSGFSKIKEGDTVHFVVSKTNPGAAKEKNRYDAVRIFVIPQEFTTQ